MIVAQRSTICCYDGSSFVSDPDLSITPLIKACVCFHLYRIFTCVRSAFSITPTFINILCYVDDLCGVSLEGQPPNHLVTDPDHSVPTVVPYLAPGGRFGDRDCRSGSLYIKSGPCCFFSSDWWMDRKREFRNVLLHPSYIWARVYAWCMRECVFIITKRTDRPSRLRNRVV